MKPKIKSNVLALLREERQSGVFRNAGAFNTDSRHKDPRHARRQEKRRLQQGDY